MLVVFAVVGALAFSLYFSEGKSIAGVSAFAIRFSSGILVGTAVLWVAAEALPPMRDAYRFDVQTYQVSQLGAAHDLAQASDLDRFGPAALNLTEKWLTLRVERIKLRMGLYVGGSDKVAVLAVLAGAWAIWNNYPSAGSDVERFLYLSARMALCRTGIGGLFVNATISRLVYQRDPVTLSICRLANTRQLNEPSRA